MESAARLPLHKLRANTMVQLRTMSSPEVCKFCAPTYSSFEVSRSPQDLILSRRCLLVDPQWPLGRTLTATITLYIPALTIINGLSKVFAVAVSI